MACWWPRAIASADSFSGRRSGKEFLALRGHKKGINAIGWLSRSDALVTAGEDGVIQVWNLHTGKTAARWDAHGSGVLWIDVHPSGRIAATGRDGRVKVWQPDGKLVADLGPISDQATRIAFTADGESLISGSWGGEVRAWTARGLAFGSVVDDAPHARHAQAHGAGTGRSGAEPRACVRSQTCCAGLLGRCARPRRLGRGW